MLKSVRCETRRLFMFHSIKPQISFQIICEYENLFRTLQRQNTKGA